MRVFVYEWTCCAENAAPSLRREGWAMLWAVLHDFELTREVQTVTLVHKDFDRLALGEMQRISNASQEQERFRDLAASADATLVIAPETDRLLEMRARWVEEVGGPLLGPTVDAIGLAADKTRCGQWWQSRGVPTPSVRTPSNTVQYPAVLKPRDGAGSQATFLVRSANEMENSLQLAKTEAGPVHFISQDYVPGQAASVAFLVGPKLTLPMPPASQLLSDDGRFHYLGGTLPLPSPLGMRAINLGRKAIAAIPGLRGYVGVDLVLGGAADGSGDFAIEINPRLTTSYLGLRMLAQDNLALAMLRVTLGHDVGKLRWRQEVIRFGVDGSLETWPQ